MAQTQDNTVKFLGRFRSYDRMFLLTADDDATRTIDHGIFAEDYVAPHSERLHLLNLRNRLAWQPVTKGQPTR